MLNSSYQKLVTVTTLHRFFESVFGPVKFSKPTLHGAFSLLLAFLVVTDNFAVKHLYERFLRQSTPHSLNSIYYLLNVIGGKLHQLELANLKQLLTLVPEDCQGQPWYLALDDTIQPKFGTHFDAVKILFDHARHTGQELVNAHSFVTLGLIIPTGLDAQGQPDYTFFPIASHLYRAKVDHSKHQQAAELIEQVLTIVPESQQLILLCDSWYPKAQINQTVQAHSNLELIANVRKDTCLYGLPVQPKVRHRGRPRKYGTAFKATDITLTSTDQQDSYGMVRCLTKLFGIQPVYVIRRQHGNSERLFLTTIDPNELKSSFDLDQSDPAPAQTILKSYSLRWRIETYFYEQKTFWHFGEYQLRRFDEIEAYHFLVNQAYTWMQILPLKMVQFKDWKTLSLRERRNRIGQRIQAEIFIERFRQKAQTCQKTLRLEIILPLMDSCAQILGEKL